MIEMSYPWKSRFIFILAEEQNKSQEYTGGRILVNLRGCRVFFIQKFVNDESLYRRKPKSKFTKADRHC